MCPVQPIWLWILQLPLLRVLNNHHNVPTQLLHQVADEGDLLAHVFSANSVGESIILWIIVGDNAWYLDSSATHHFTNSTASMTESTPYSGLGMIYMGDGVALPIIRTSQSSSLTYSRPLHIRSLLFVHNITKNLMFVSKFAKDNQVLFEFFS